MATTDEVREQIEDVARQLCKEMGDVDDSNSLSWLDAARYNTGVQRVVSDFRVFLCAIRESCRGVHSFKD